MTNIIPLIDVADDNCFGIGFWIYISSTKVLCHDVEQNRYKHTIVFKSFSFLEHVIPAYLWTEMHHRTNWCHKPYCWETWKQGCMFLTKNNWQCLRRNMKPQEALSVRERKKWSGRPIDCPWCTCWTMQYSLCQWKSKIGEEQYQR